LDLRFGNAVKEIRGSRREPLVHIQYEGRRPGRWRAPSASCSPGPISFVRH
jgi:hypothetical protein